MNPMRQSIALIFTILCFLLLPLLIHCGGGPAKKPVYPAKVDSRMKSAFAVAEQQYRRRNLTSALKKYKEFINTFPYTQLTDEAHYKSGKIYFLKKNWGSAIAEFDRLAKKTPDAQYRAKAWLMAGYSAYKQGDFKRSSTLLRKASIDHLTTKLKLRYYSLLILNGRKLSRPQDQIDYAFLRMADLYQESSDSSVKNLRAQDVFTRRQVLKHLDAWVLTSTPSGRIPSWFKNYPSGYSRAYVDYKWGKVLFDAGNREKARRQLSKFVSAYSKHVYSKSARKMLEDLGGALTVATGDTIRIGVLVPLSGPRAPFGRTLLRGIECGAGIKSGCVQTLGDEAGFSQPIELIIRDSGSNPEEVDKVINDLARHHVSAIIGPMSGSLAEAAGKRAQQIKVPLLPITQKPGVVGMGNYVFPMGYRAGQQMHDLVAKARSRGLKAFGVFYPRTNYGKEMTNLFVAEVESQGGRIVTKASYNPAKPDWTNSVRRLKTGIRRFYAGSQAGFQALFIPDSYRAVNRLIPALAFVGIRGIPLLGTNAWNDAGLSALLGQEYPRSFFLDLFYTGNSNKIAPKFVRGYRSSFGKNPTSIEALGFEAVWFIRRAVHLSGSTKRKDIKQALLGGGIQGVTGIRGFREGVGPIVHPFVLTAGEKGIMRVK